MKSLRSESFSMPEKEPMNTVSVTRVLAVCPTPGPTAAVGGGWLPVASTVKSGATRWEVAFYVPHLSSYLNICHRLQLYQHNAN